ncbi:MAG: anthranilate phosphoribosyltransferase [Myxococcota bacterium]|nr:anthranilate phosphoribosyltransferase [Myxococcota bacterium]
MSLPDAITSAASGREVPAAELEAAFGTIMDGEATPAQIAALLVALRTKGETVAEIAAAARALRTRASMAPLVDDATVDTCGTGGSGSAKTFNVSTTAAFVAAGAGVRVAKHGNRAASSRSGSFDVLEELGVAIELPIDVCARVLEEVGIGVFFARTAHPAMRHVAPIRQELGMRTIMNCLGPLLNPVGAKYQVIGVYDAGLVVPIAEALDELGCRGALVVHGSDGLDELTTRGLNHVARLEAGRVETLEIDPRALGIAEPAAAALEGGEPAHNAAILRAVLEGEAGARRDIVALNAAAAIWVAGAAPDLASGLDLAYGSIDSGAAREKLDALVRATQERAT